MMTIEEKRQFMREINPIQIFILSENVYSIEVSSSVVSPKGSMRLRLTKLRDENGVYVEFRNRKVYQNDWIREF